MFFIDQTSEHFTPKSHRPCLASVRGSPPARRRPGIRPRRGDQLVLSFAPVLLGEEASDSPAWGAVIEDFVLLENLAQLDIRYQVDPTQPWADKAAEGDSGFEGDSFLPRAVSINWALIDQELPPVTVQIDASEVGW